VLDHETGTASGGVDCETDCREGNSGHGHHSVQCTGVVDYDKSKLAPRQVTRQAPVAKQQHSFKMGSGGLISSRENISLLHCCGCGRVSEFSYAKMTYPSAFVC